MLPVSYLAMVHWKVLQGLRHAAQVMFCVWLPLPTRLPDLLLMYPERFCLQASSHMMRAPARPVCGRQGVAWARFVAARAAGNEAAERVPANGLGPGLLSERIYIHVLVTAHKACLKKPYELACHRQWLGHYNAARRRLPAVRAGGKR